jgi:hypothetical protein
MIFRVKAEATRRNDTNFVASASRRTMSQLRKWRCGEKSVIQVRPELSLSDRR